MSEKEIKIENEITETPISEVTSPAKLKSKEENQNNKGSETTDKEKVEEQIENTSEIKEEVPVSKKEKKIAVITKEQIEETSEIKEEEINKPETETTAELAKDKIEIIVEEPEKDYTLLTDEELISELKAIIENKPVQEIKSIVEIIKTEFNSKFNDELELNKKTFLAEGGNIIDFYYTTPIKKAFDTAYYNYKDKRSNHYKNLLNDQKTNLLKREELIEELKSLFNAKENTSTIYKRFRDIQERWFDAGSIPRDKNNTVWNNYYHHVENFYNILHLDREFRDRNFKQNLEQKLRIIGRAEELTKEEDNNVAFRELQMLHKMERRNWTCSKRI